MTPRLRSSLQIFVALAVLLAIPLGVVFLRPVWTSQQFIRLHMWQQGVASNYAFVDGHRLHYYEARAAHGATGEPLLLIHGLGGQAEDWSPLIPTLTSQGYHVYAVDLLGYGRSQRPDVDYSVPLQARTVEHLLDQLGVDHAIVGGWSMGGWVAQTIALDQPQRVTRLLLYDSVGLYFPLRFDPSLFAPTTAGDIDALYALLTPHPHMVPSFVARDLLRRARRDGWVVQRSVLSMLVGRDLMDFRLSALRQPTLIVWGAQDALVPLSAGETMHRLIENSSLVEIEGCGHLAPGECSGAALDATLRFLAEKQPVRGSEITVYPEGSSKPGKPLPDEQEAPQ